MHSLCARPPAFRCVLCLCMCVRARSLTTDDSCRAVDAHICAFVSGVHSRNVMRSVFWWPDLSGRPNFGNGKNRVEFGSRYRFDECDRKQIYVSLSVLPGTGPNHISMSCRFGSLNTIWMTMYLHIAITEDVRASVSLASGLLSDSKQQSSEIATGLLDTSAMSPATLSHPPPFPVLRASSQIIRAALSVSPHSLNHQCGWCKYVCMHFGRKLPRA